METMVTLNPCPKCGGEAIIYHNVKLECRAPKFTRQFMVEAHPVCVACGNYGETEASDWIEATDPRDDEESALNKMRDELDEKVAAKWNEEADDGRL